MSQSIAVAAAQSAPLSRAALISVTLAVVLVPLNSTMMAVALPEIMRDLHIGIGAAGWLVTAYLITMVILQLVAGRLGDAWGKRRAVLGGLIYFGCASLLATFSSNLEGLLLARVQQAIAAAFLATNGFALAYEIVPADRRGNHLGLLNAGMVLSAAGGPPLSGLLISLAGWRSIFWVNVPLVLVALILGWSSLPAGVPSKNRDHLDSVGALSLFGRRTFVCANATILLMNLAVYMLFLAIPIFLAGRTGWQSFQTGLVLAAMSVALALCSPLGGRLCDFCGRRLPNVLGLSVLMFGPFLLTVLNGDITLSTLLTCLGLVGAGVGLCSISLQTAALESVGPKQTGMASGIASTSRYVGSIVGSAILTGLSASAKAGNFRSVFLVATLSGLGAMLVSLGIRNSEVQHE